MDPTALPMRWIRTLVIAASLALVVGALSLARAILIPVVLAILLSFILSPLVTWLQRRRVRRAFAVIMVLALALAVVTCFGVAVFSQVQSLAVDLPQHKKTILHKIEKLREAGQGSWFDKLYQTFQEINRERKKGEDTEEQPLAVTVVDTNQFGFLPSVGRALAEFLVDVVLVIILVAFMLLRREDLRNRAIRLSGEGNITSMTKALDDATHRISRFLLAQFLINSTYGIAIAIGLYFIGVPYPLLWGVLAGAFRYLPYIGPWIGCAFPLALSIAVFPGWTETLLVFGLFLGLELVTSNVVEPLLFGQSTGVSEVALLIAAAFWAWLWGPLGLLLSAPLTACLVVLGRYIPQLEFFDVLLGDEPVLPVEVTFYQRLLARDEHEAVRLAEDHAAKETPEAVYDKVFVPALTLTAENHERGRVSDDDMEFITQTISELIDDFAPRERKVAGSELPQTASPGTPVLMLGCPARDEADEMVLQMLGQMLDPKKCQLEVVSAKTLSAEVVHRVEQEKPPLVCIASLPPRGLTHTRYLCKRLRSRFPNLKLVVLFLGREGQRERTTERLREAGADAVVNSLEECRTQLTPILQVLTHSEEVRERAAEPALVNGR